MSVALLGFSQTSRPDSLSLKPAADTTLFETTPDNNLGGAPTLVAGTTAQGFRSRALVQFDFTQLPPGVVVSSASLRVQVVKASTLGGKASDFELHRVLDAWGEGDKSGSNGALAGQGEATWRMRFAPNTAWSSPGGAASVDFDSAPGATSHIDTPGSYTFESSPALVADIQFWVDHPTANFGWLLQTAAEQTAQTARRFGSREDPDNAPIFTVEFVPASVSIRFSSISLTGTNVLLSWTGPAVNYQVQATSDLGSTNWTAFGPTTSGTSAVLPILGSRACFRLLTVPTATTP